MRRTAMACSLALGWASCGAHAQWSGSGYLQSQWQSGDTDQHWLQGGTEVLGAPAPLTGEARLGARYEGTEWSLQVSGLARHEGSVRGGRRAGLLEAHLDYGSLNAQGYRLRAGFGFAGTSRENVEAFWQSPYTLTLSALNSWIGEEFRPLGVEMARRWTRSSGATLDIAAAAYIGNDTGPAVLTWRGYALHHRLSVYGEALPLPALQSLGAEGGFAAQRDDGTQPFGPDLDGRVGYSLRLRYTTPEGPLLSVFYTDNRGDRLLHGGDEYAWDTRFGIVGLEWPLAADWVLLAESQWGRTQMGVPPGPNVGADFQAHYLLLSYTQAAWQFSGRVEHFAVDERDFSMAEINTQRGNAFTLAAMYRQGEWLVGLEAQHAHIRRPGNGFDLLPGAVSDPQQGGTRLSVVVRRYF